MFQRVRFKSNIGICRVNNLNIREKPVDPQTMWFPYICISVYAKTHIFCCWGFFWGGGGGGHGFQVQRAGSIILYSSWHHISLVPSFIWLICTCLSVPVPIPLSCPSPHLGNHSNVFLWVSFHFNVFL